MRWSFRGERSFVAFMKRLDDSGILVFKRYIYPVKKMKLSFPTRMEIPRVYK
jgi:hypothetical protein